MCWNRIQNKRSNSKRGSINTGYDVISLISLYSLWCFSHNYLISGLVMEKNTDTMKQTSLLIQHWLVRKEGSTVKNSSLVESGIYKGPMKLYTKLCLFACVHFSEKSPQLYLPFKGGPPFFSKRWSLSLKKKAQN